MIVASNAISFLPKVRRTSVPYERARYRSLNLLCVGHEQCVTHTQDMSHVIGCYTTNHVTCASYF